MKIWQIWQGSDDPHSPLCLGTFGSEQEADSFVIADALKGLAMVLEWEKLDELTPYMKDRLSSVKEVVETLSKLSEEEVRSTLLTLKGSLRVTESKLDTVGSLKGLFQKLGLQFEEKEEVL